MSVFLTIIISVALGILSGLGVGGGSLLMIWLTLVQQMDYVTAKYLNLLFFLPPALISTLINLIQKRLSFKTVFPAALAGSLAVILFTWLSNGWNVELLRKLFGAMLLCTSIRELCYKSKQRNSL